MTSSTTATAVTTPHNGVAPQAGSPASTTVPAQPRPRPARVADSRATITTMVVCVPDGVGALELLDGFETSIGVTVTPAAWLWAKSNLWFWQRRALIGARRPRKGAPHRCAGGKVRRLDLGGLRESAAFHAGLRHQVWTEVVAGTKAARPWHEFEAQHRANPARITLAEARSRFFAQPRINAMRVYNAAHPGKVQVDPYEVEQFQTGHGAYRNYHALQAVCGDGLITDDGRRLLPDSDTFADRISYLREAWQILKDYPQTGTLIAVAL